MNVPTLLLVKSLLTGVLLGLLYFGGLWLTIHRARRAEHPYGLLAGSFLVRIAALLAALWLVMSAGWQHVAVAMIGFLVARQVLVLGAGRVAKHVK